jgi:hypothetical protein
MSDSLDALEMRPAVPAAAPVEPAEDVMFPALPAEIEGANDYAKGLTERNAKARLKASAILILRQQGYNRREIGRMVGLTPNAVRVALWRARQAGKLNELRGILENDSLALAIESLNFHLKAKDKDATFETLKGLGQFRDYNNSKIDGAPAFTMPALQVTIVNAPNAGGQQIVSAPIGVPREDAP